MEVGLVEEVGGEIADLLEVPAIQIRIVQHALQQGAGGGTVIERQRLHVASAIGVGSERFIRVPFDPFPEIGVLVVVEVIVPRGSGVGVQVAEQHVHRGRAEEGVHLDAEVDARLEGGIVGVVDEVEQGNQVAPVVEVLVRFQFVAVLVGGLVLAVVDEVGGRGVAPGSGRSTAEVVAGLEQVAVVLEDVPIEELVVDLLDHGVEPPWHSVEGDVGEAGPRSRHIGLPADIEEQLFPHAGRVLESVAEVELLESVVVLARDVLVEVNLEGLLGAGVAVAGVALESDPDAVDGMRPTDVGKRQVGDDVLVLVRVVIVLQFGPEVGLREIQVHADDLINREDVVPVDLRLKPEGRQEGA